MRILEVAQWTFAPAAAAVFADLGADVLKIEHPVTGDPQRGLVTSGMTPSLNDVNLVMAQTNRGKRSLGLDLRDEQGMEILRLLIDRSDVFLTNFLGPARTKLGIDEHEVRERNPRIVYARATGQGPLGPAADRGGYDASSFWMHGGIASTLGTPGDLPPNQPPAFGDKAGAMNLAFGIASALYRRERTGLGSTVDVSLLSTALWQNSSALVYSAASGTDFRVQGRAVKNPLVHGYLTADGRTIGLVLLESDRYWPDLCRHLGRPDLVDDVRFRDSAARSRNAADCVAELTRIFASAPWAQWKVRLEGLDAPWSVAQHLTELSDDEQVRANDYLCTSDQGGTEVTLVPPPTRFDGESPVLTRAPEHGEHSEEVMLELGFSWEQIAKFKDAGVL
ncbi:CaiB/BaiF CoA transferase family protein [Pseudonocardia pini]|uniref:CaiB/BaiF CoA transferase family protein n=1 Tax=Pseudonocardia pini TaxID=2758030 RepID=UPI001C691296|nr:CoA transferase [Pseudonocardia pini]